MPSPSVSVLQPPLSQDRSLMRIAILVIATHLALLVYAYFDADVPKPVIAPPIKRLVVQTVAIGEPPPPVPTETLIVEEEPPAPIVEAPPPEPPPVEKIPEPEPEKAPPPQEEPPKPVEKPKPAEPKVEKPKPKPKPVEKKKPEPPKKKSQPAKKPEPKKQVKKSPEKPKPKPKPVEKKKSPEKKTTPEPKKPDPAVEAANVKRRSLLEKAQKNIANIEQTKDKITASKASTVAVGDLPKKIESLHVEAVVGEPTETLTKQEIGYHSELASRLKLKLRLPEYGEVKIKLTLERTGKFVKVEIVHAASSANRKYVEKTLPTLSFPGFGSNFAGEDKHTFTIVLSNDI